MAELEKVVISAEGRGFETLQAKMAALSASAKMLQQRQRSLSGSMGGTNKQMRQQYNSTNNLIDRTKILNAYLNKSSQASRLMAKSARFLMFAVIGLAVEFAVVAVSLMSINAAFAAGNAIMKAYRWSMGAVAGAAAAAGAALAIAAAAQREFTAAQYAHTQKATPKFGSAMNYSIAMLRNLTTDAELAVFGVENLNAAFAGVAKNSQFTGKSQQVIRALRDFAAIGSGGQGKNLAAIGEFVGLLQKEGKVTSKVTEAAKAIGPEFEKAFKKIKKGGGSVEEVFKSILSGDLSKAAGITGAADLMSGTLFGMFKKYATLVRGLFADIGTPLLAPAKDALQQIFFIIQNGIRRISPGLTQFGKGPFLDTIVKATEKITDFTVKLFDKYLPQSEGMLGSIKNVYLEFKKMWQFITSSLDRLRNGGSIVIDMFAKPLKELFVSIGENVEHFSQLAVDNKDDFLAFGDSLAGVVDALMDFAAKFKEAFVAALPTINQVLGVVEKIVRMLTGLTGFFANTVPFGGELITGIAGYGILKGRREAQRQNRRGVNMKAAAGGMGQAALSMMGMPMYAGRGVTYVDPNTGVMSTGSQVNAARGAARVNSGPIGKRLFAGGRFRGLNTAMSFMSGQFNPMESSKLARQAYFEANDFMMDEQRPRDPNTGRLLSAAQARQLPGAYQNSKGQWVTSNRVANPAAKTGMARQFGGAKAMFRGGFSMGGMLAGAAISSFANSGMAPSMMKENAGAINMGAGLMAINPALGLAAMGGGTMLNLIKGKGARTAAGGTLTGAAAGAAMGAFAGPIGMAIGGLIGGAIGFFGGKKAERMAAREAAKTVTYDSLRGITTSLLKGSTSGAMAQIDKFSKGAAAYSSMSGAQRKDYITKLEKDGVITKTQAERARSQTGAFGNELTKQATDLQAAGTATINQFEEIMKGLRGSTGMTNEELLDLAKTMNVNLYDPTLKLTDALTGLGKTMDLTAKGLAASGTDIMLKSLRVFDEVRKSDALVAGVDAAGKGIAQAGGGSKNDYMDLMQKSVEFLASNYQDNPLAQLYALQGTFGVGGSAFGPGGQLQGLEGNFRQNGGEMYNKLVKEQSGQLATSRGGGIMQLVAQSGYQFADGALGFGGLRSQLEKMYTSSDKKVQKQASDLEAFLASGASLGSNPAQIAKTLASFGIKLDTLETSKAGTLADQLTDQQKELQTALVNAIGTGFDDKPEWWNGTPAWWGNSGTGTPDTSSPRAGGVGDTVSSRLGRTMSRHNYFNSMLTGKRMVTSSWRNHSLGSPSSDHVTGNAYDLVGQNLGQYSTMINKAGGFAEFHGAAGSRHLHVVPPSSPVGDSGTSRIGQVAPSVLKAAPSGEITINVYATERQSEQEIARMVMNEITRAQRNYRERR